MVGFVCSYSCLSLLGADITHTRTYSYCMLVSVQRMEWLGLASLLQQIHASSSLRKEGLPLSHGLRVCLIQVEKWPSIYISCLSLIHPGLCICWASSSLPSSTCPAARESATGSAQSSTARATLGGLCKVPASSNSTAHIL